MNKIISKYVNQRRSSQLCGFSISFYAEEGVAGYLLDGSAKSSLEVVLFCEVLDMMVGVLTEAEDYLLGVEVPLKFLTNESIVIYPLEPFMVCLGVALLEFCLELGWELIY